MKPLYVVKNLYEFKNTINSFISCSITAKINMPCFRGMKETFNHGVLIATSFMSHTQFYVILFGKALKILACIFTAPI